MKTVFACILLFCASLAHHPAKADVVSDASNFVSSMNSDSCMTTVVIDGQSFDVPCGF